MSLLNTNYMLYILSVVVNSMFNILLVEDDEIQRNNLKKMINELGDIYTIFEASNTKDALNISINGHIDLFYVDVNIHDDSGINFALEVRKQSKYKLTWIVFITSYVEYMLEAFKKVHCYDYILKPYEKEKIQDITKLLINSTQNLYPSSPLEKKSIIVNSKDIDIKIFVEDIYFIEVYLHTSIIHTKNGEYKVDRLPLKKISSILNVNNIMQCHRSYLVNLDHIKCIENNNIYFYNYDKIAQVTRNFKRTLLDNFKFAKTT